MCADCGTQAIAMSRRRSNPAAFTLLELILVMVIICTALALAAPSLNGWARGSKMRNAVDQFVALTQFARTQAVSTATVHRLQIDGAARAYYVLIQDGDQFVPLNTEMGREFSLPTDFSLKMTDDAGQNRDFVDFYPTGRTDPARVEITAPDGETKVIQCPSPTEAFRLVNPGDGQ
jgi:prepilin-type N-terminal cleavage/methylation domain-containing protein